MREPMIEPISAQNSMVLMCSAVTPRRTPIRPRSHPPIMNPIAMPSPCGETANASPNRNRSRTGHPTDASVEKDEQHRERVYRRPSLTRPGHSRPIARPINSPLTTSEG